MTNPTPPEALQDEIPEQLPFHRACVSRDSTLGGHMCSCGYGYPGISYEMWSRHYTRELALALVWMTQSAKTINKNSLRLEAELAAARSESVRQFNAGIEAAADFANGFGCLMEIVPGETRADYLQRFMRRLVERIRALSESPCTKEGK